MIDMPHSCEVTIERLDDAITRYADRLGVDGQRALARAALVLRRIATEDRERMAEERR